MATTTILLIVLGFLLVILAFLLADRPKEERKRFFRRMSYVEAYKEKMGGTKYVPFITAMQGLVDIRKDKQKYEAGLNALTPEGLGLCGEDADAFRQWLDAFRADGGTPLALVRLTWNLMCTDDMRAAIRRAELEEKRYRNKFKTKN